MKNQNSGFLSQRSQTGLSMVELMIAMLLGLVLMGGVVEIFLGSKQSYNLQEAQSRIQENGRLSMHFLPHDIRMADFQGCRSRQKYTGGSLHIIANQTASDPSKPASQQPPDLTPGLFDITKGIDGLDNLVAGTTETVTNLPVVARGTAGTSLAIIEGTDMIHIQFVGNCNGNLTGNYDPSNANIQINGLNTCNIKKHWPYLISDCVDADVFRAESINKTSSKETVAHPNSVNTANRLSKDYGKDAEIYTLQSVSYFIGRNPVGNNSLYRRDNYNNQTDELVEGVEDMQVLYGVDDDADGTPNYYADAATIRPPAVVPSDMPKVLSVKMTLLLRSLADGVVTTKPVTYTYNGVTYNDGTTPAPLVDRQLRKVFTTTVTLRNRLP